MNLVAPLLAQIPWDDLIAIIAVILFIVVPAVLQLLGRNKEQAQKQKPPQQKPRPDHPRPANQAGRQPAGGQPAGRQAAGGVEDEIDDFLRKVAGGPARKQPARQARPARPVAKPRPVEQPVEAEVVGHQPLGKRLSEHVGEYLDTDEFQKRSSELGEKTAQTDVRVKKRLHKKFDHEVSRFDTALEAEEPGEPIEIPALAAAGLPALLSDADNLRQAIILSEILQRPEDRWT